MILSQELRAAGLVLEQGHICLSPSQVGGKH
jgi:hypothetical protein